MHEVNNTFILNKCSNKSFNNRSLPEDSVWLESTALKNAIVCFPEKRNIHNKIFGGYVMRKAYELAWANATIFGLVFHSIELKIQYKYKCHGVR